MAGKVRSYDDSLANCKTLGGSLAIPESEDDMQWIMQEISKILLT